MTRLRVRLKPGIERELAWGRPDSPQRSLCSKCHGSLPTVPLVMWASDGSAIQLCNGCVKDCIEVIQRPALRAR